MSQENVERLRVWLEAWDLDDLANGVFDSSLVDPDVTYEDEILPDHAAEVYRGYEGMAHAGRVWLEPFETYSLKLERVVDAGEFVCPFTDSERRFDARASSSICRLRGSIRSETEESRVGEHFLPRWRRSKPPGRGSRPRG